MCPVRSFPGCGICVGRGGGAGLSLNCLSVCISVLERSSGCGGVRGGGLVCLVPLVWGRFFAVVVCVTRILYNWLDGVGYSLHM